MTCGVFCWAYTITSGEVTITGKVDTNDAVRLLLLHISSPELFPLTVWKKETLEELI